jgi:signal transduction histidine kinase
LVFKVTDQCGGIKPVILKNLFKPFVSGEKKGSGLGLGLTIVERAVAMIQGKISVENKPGTGCAFIVQIPIAIPAMRKKMVSGRDSVQPRRKR